MSERHGRCRADYAKRINKRLAVAGRRQKREASRDCGRGGTLAYHPGVVEPASSDTAAPRARPQSLRILVADDDRDAVITIAALLEHEGHEVREVYRGSEVLRLVRDFDPDVVLLDISMPGMTGYDVAREVRQLFGEHRPILIAVTGWKKSADLLLAKMTGFNHHLGKPFEPDALLGLLAGIAPKRG